ncbi:MAG: metallopeptidase family protein [Solirubrobacterales bacterium]
MREAMGPSLRAAALVAFLTGVIWLLIDPPSFGGIGGLVTVLAGALAFVLVIAWIAVTMIGKEVPEPEFRKLVDRSEALAALPPPDRPPTEFDELVIEALDGLPEDFQRVLERTPVIVSSGGREYRAYGLYSGDTIARDNYAHRIVIYQDTLERDFGHDHALLRAQVERTVRHEIAHHLGWDEPGVRGLGL